jgi:hypothetical protein
LWLADLLDHDVTLDALESAHAIVDTCLTAARVVGLDPAQRDGGVARIHPLGATAAGAVHVERHLRLAHISYAARPAVLAVLTGTTETALDEVGGAMKHPGRKR